jgi:hypothetical protein
MNLNSAKLQYEIKKIGFVVDYNFYIPDEGDDTGMAYSRATSLRCYQNKELCVYVGSMLC